MRVTFTTKFDNIQLKGRKATQAITVIIILNISFFLNEELKKVYIATSNRGNTPVN